MKKAFVVMALVAAVGAQAAPQKTTRAAGTDRAPNRSVVAVQAQPAAKKAASPRAATTEESGSCFSCYWHAGLLQPLTFEEDLKFDMCKIKYCY